MLSYRKMERSGSDMTFYQILWTFFIYSFVGWCCEVAFAACKTGQFVNRGFLFGPQSQISPGSRYAPHQGHLRQYMLSPPNFDPFAVAVQDVPRSRHRPQGSSIIPKIGHLPLGIDLSTFADAVNVLLHHKITSFGSRPPGSGPPPLPAALRGSRWHRGSPGISPGKYYLRHRSGAC